ncbi:MAG: restriction endonuclease subunit S [Cyanobacteria bacterium]|nr:restriction endonuclease subunit S [Cyanobacteriota bacterium]
MSDWYESTLGQVCDAVNGLIQTGPFGSQLHQSDYTEHGVPVVMPKDIVGGRITSETVARVSVDHVERLSRHKLNSGDIIYGRRGDIGRQALIRSDQAGWMCGTGCLRISLGESTLDPHFLHYYLSQDEVISWITNQAVGATMPNLNTAILRSVPVSYPDLPVQRRIAGILSSYDDLIENSQRRIKILEEMARRLYREWFVHFRFPGHEGCRLVESPLGEIPEGWAICELNDFVQFKSGFAFKSGTFAADGEYRLVTIKNVQDGVFNPESDTRMSEVPANMPTYCVLNDKDILLSLTGNVGRVCLVHDGPFLLNQRVSKLAPVEAFDWAMVYCMFRQPEMRVKLEQISNGVAQQNVSPVLASKIDFAQPPRELRRRFSIIAEPMGLSIVQLYTTIQNLRRTRDLLLPRLLSGQIDVDSLPEPVLSES